MGKKREDICVPRKSSQRVTSAEEDLNNQVDRMTCYVNTVNLFSQPPLSLHNGPMNKAAILARTEVMHGLSYMSIHSPRPTWLRQSLRAQSGSNRDRHWAPCMVPSPWVNKLIILDHFHPGKGSVLFLMQ